MKKKRKMFDGVCPIKDCKKLFSAYTEKSLKNQMDIHKLSKHGGKNE
jgi:hypothetical protein